jgi:hypothetical protein
MLRSISALLSAYAVLSLTAHMAYAQEGAPPGFARKLGMDVDVRSFAKITADRIRPAHGFVVPSAPGVAAGVTVPQIQLRGQNTQVNDPALDSFNAFPGFPPLMNITQSETSLAVNGNRMIAGYNSSAGAKFVDSGLGYLLATQFYFSGYSVSTDRGNTWRSGFVPPVAGSVFTLGDPSVGVDRSGIFYYANLGLTADFRSTIQVTRSIDGGQTWSAAAVLQQDDGGDKEWLAVGPDPGKKNRDNVYVTWTSFQPTACELRFAKSADQGQTWTAKTIFVPGADPDPRKPQNCLQFSAPVVDQKTGVLYVPFINFSNADADYIRVLASADGGGTFHLLKFNAPGSLVADALPFVQAGTLTECGAFDVAPGVFFPNLRLTIHAGADTGGSLTGLPRYVAANRLIAEPSMAARDGVLYLAWPASTSAYYGDPSSRSNAWFIRSDDGGNTWTAPVPVNPLIAADPQHIGAHLTIDQDPNDVHVIYYTQHANGTVDVDLANSHDRGATFPLSRTVRVSSTSFNLPPTNVPVPIPSNPYQTANSDQLIAQCYALGEYLSATTGNGTVYGLWGDGRNLVTEPADGLLGGQTHAQMDVFFQAIKAQ